MAERSDRPRGKPLVSETWRPTAPAAPPDPCPDWGVLEFDLFVTLYCDRYGLRYVIDPRGPKSDRTISDSELKILFQKYQDRYGYDKVAEGRRTVVIGIASALGLAALGGLAWLMHQVSQDDESGKPVNPPASQTP